MSRFLTKERNLGKIFKIFHELRLVKYTKSGDIREKVHLFSSRTQKLSFSSPKILD